MNLGMGVLMSLVPKAFALLKKYIAKKQAQHYQKGIDKCINYIKENDLYVSKDEFKQVLTNYVRSDDLDDKLKSYQKKKGGRKRVKV